MTMRMKLSLSCLAAFITGAAMYWQQLKPTDALDMRFWISMFFAGAVPVASYFGGLAQRAPWEGPELPQSTVATKTLSTSPVLGTVATEKTVTTTDPPPKTPATP